MGMSQRQVGQKGTRTEAQVRPASASRRKLDNLIDAGTHPADGRLDDDFREQIICRLSELGFQLAAAASISPPQAQSRIHTALRELDDVIHDLREPGPARRDPQQG
jgi:hypothetical protein